VTECLENTVCNETETDAKRSLWNYDREKCVHHPTTDGRVARAVRILLRANGLSSVGIGM
jgi:hypothetical protein